MAGHFRSITALIAVACMAASTCVITACVNTARTAYTAVNMAFDWVCSMALKPFKPEPLRPLPGLAVQLIAAKQYLMRQVKRERPNMTPGWRMAPST